MDDEQKKAWHDAIMQKVEMYGNHRGKIVPGEGDSGHYLGIAMLRNISNCIMNALDNGTRVSECPNTILWK